MELQSVLQLVLQEKKNIVRPPFQNLSREDITNYIRHITIYQAVNITTPYHRT